MDELMQCGLLACLEQQEQEQEQAVAEGEGNEAVQVKRVRAMLPVLEKAYAVLAPALHAILINQETADNTSTATHTADAKADATAKAGGGGGGGSSGGGSGGAAQAQAQAAPLTLPRGSKISACPVSDYPAGGGYAWVLPREVVDSVSRSPCWHTTAPTPAAPAPDSASTSASAGVGDGSGGGGGRLERIFGCVKAQSISTALSQWRLAEQTRQPEDDGQRDEILAFYRQLVISVSATQKVDRFSIEIYEHAVEAAVYATRNRTRTRTRTRTRRAVSKLLSVCAVYAVCVCITFSSPLISSGHHHQSSIINQQHQAAGGLGALPITCLRPPQRAVPTRTSAAAGCCCCCWWWWWFGQG